MLTIRAVPGAPLETNCYLVADVEAGEAILVDAPWQIVAPITRLTEELQVTIRTIVCTHGHWDHTMGLAELAAATGAHTACHPADAAMLEHPSFLPFSFPFTLVPVTPDVLLREGEVVAVGTHRLTVWHTPGHTPGGICLYTAEEACLFSGDTLFAGTYGRTDLPNGDPAQMVQSLSRLATLPAETRVYPGHGPETAIGREPWLAQADEVMEE